MRAMPGLGSAGSLHVQRPEQGRYRREIQRCVGEAEVCGAGDGELVAGFGSVLERPLERVRVPSPPSVLPVPRPETARTPR